MNPEMERRPGANQGGAEMAGETSSHTTGPRGGTLHASLAQRAEVFDQIAKQRANAVASAYHALSVTRSYLAAEDATATEQHHAVQAVCDALILAIKLAASVELARIARSEP